MHLSSESESESSENLKGKKFAEKEARRLTKLFGVKWEARWELWLAGEERKPYWQWSAACAEPDEKFHLHPPLQLSDRAKKSIAQMLVVVGKGWSYDVRKAEEKNDSYDDDDDSVGDAATHFLFRLLGMPEYKNPSGDEGYRGPRDFCYDSFYDDLGDIWKETTVEARLAKALELVERCLSCSVYRDEQEDAALMELYPRKSRESEPDFHEFQ